MEDKKPVEITSTDGSYPHRTVVTLSKLATDHVGSYFDQIVELVSENDKVVFAHPLTAYGWISNGVYHLHIGHTDDPEDKQDEQ